MNSSNKPVISVVMPVLNGEKYLRKAIESVLNQSFKDFEFIIINDGSTDTTEEIIKSYQDPRIVYIKNSSNKGLSVSFNIGIRIARGTYIARMDADDICVLDRLERQLSFLKNYSNIDIVGSSVILTDGEGRNLKQVNRPTNHMDIKWKSLFSTPVFHPTVFAKSEILKNNPYDESLSNSEDYELWSRLLFTTNTQFANIDEPLLFYRISGFTHKLNESKRINSAQNSIKNIEHYTELSEHEKNNLILLRQDKDLPASDLWDVMKLYKRATESFHKKEKRRGFKILFICPKLLGLSAFLIKYKIKHLIRRPLTF